MVIKIISILLFLIFFVNSLKLKGDSGKNFSSSCDNIKLNGSTLSATCKNRKNTKFNSSIDLNKFIGIDRGQLKFKIKGNYSQDVDSCKLESTILKCVLKSDQSNVEINLNDVVGNSNGSLYN